MSLGICRLELQSLLIMCYGIIDLAYLGQSNGQIIVSAFWITAPVSQSLLIMSDPFHRTPCLHQQGAEVSVR